MGKSVMERTGYSDKEKTMMLMPQQTHLGTSKYNMAFKCHHYYLTTIVSSFLELVPYLFSIPEVRSFLSKKLSQDSLEKLFS